MAELWHRELTHAVIGAYYEVYIHPSRLYPEYVYARAFILEWQQRGYGVAQQDGYCIVYTDRLLGWQWLDLCVMQEIVVENKVTPRLVLRGLDVAPFKRMQVKYKNRTTA